MNLFLIILLVIAVIMIFSLAWEIRQLKKEISFYRENDQMKDELKEPLEK